MSHPTNINNNGPVIKYTDMKEEMKNEVLETAKLGNLLSFILAIDKCNYDKDIACYIKNEFMKRYLGTWHCVVGRFFGSFVSHEKEHYIYFYMG